jgi:hypothetical protein
MSIIKLAFLGVHVRKLGPKESEYYVKKHEKALNTYKKYKKPIIGGMGALYGGVGAAVGMVTKGNKKAALIGSGIGTLAGLGIGAGTHALDVRSGNKKIERLKNLDKKWLVFGKGQSHLDNQ